MCLDGLQKTIIVVDDALMFVIMFQLCLCLLFFTSFCRFGFFIIYSNCCRQKIWSLFCTAIIHKIITFIYMHMCLCICPSNFCRCLIRTQCCEVVPVFPRLEGNGGVQTCIYFQFMAEVTEMNNSSCIFSLESLEPLFHTFVYLL